VKQAATNNVKAIFLEKPISNSLVNAKKIIEICKTNNIKLAIDHQRRFNPFYQLIRGFLEQKKLGEIQFVNVYYGSGIANTGSHLFDVLRLFFDEIVSIKSQSTKINTINPTDPNIDATIKFQKNVICQLHTLDYNKYAILEIDILGTLGRIRLDMISDQIQYFKTTKGLVYQTLTESKLNLKKPSKTPIQLAVQNLIETIGSSKEPLCTGYDGYKSLEMITAATISSKSQKEIKIPLKNNYKITSK
jgi:predicted dehydrogenase